MVVGCRVMLVALSYRGSFHPAATSAFLYAEALGLAVVSSEVEGLDRARAWYLFGTPDKTRSAIARLTNRL